MDAVDKERIIQRYDKRLAQYADDIRTLASGTEERRRLRFEVLAQIGIQSGCSVLDLGCGFGDFFAYLKERGVKCRYVGYDINSKLIAVARQKHPAAEFAVRDIQVDEFPEFDFIVSSSAFNLRLASQDNYDFLADVLKRCYEHARSGVAVDLLSSYVDFESQDAFHYKPERVFSLAKAITKRVCLRHDNPLYEFCIYLYPDFEGWQQTCAS
jgi:SAM-dependent methyltransferase